MTDLAYFQSLLAQAKDESMKAFYTNLVRTLTFQQDCVVHSEDVIDVRDPI